MKRELLIEKRKKARELREKGWSIRKIARYLVCSKNSVMRWVQMGDGEVGKDGRGWEKGRSRKFKKTEKERVVEIGKQLRKKGAALDPGVIRLEYRRRFGDRLSEWFINRTLEEYRESKHTLIHRKEKTEQYRKKRERLLRKLGNVVMDVDFWGSKYGRGSKDSLKFLSCRYIYPARLGILSRVSTLSGKEVMGILKSTWRNYKKPDLVEMGNHPAFGAGLSHAGCIGSLALFLLNLGVKPLYSIFRDSGGRGDSVEEERIFSDRFLGRLHFEDNPDILEIENFHLEYRRKSDTLFPKIKNKTPYYIDAFMDSELANRDVGRFLETDIFFYE